MPRLFYGNFDFEESLANPGRARSATVRRLVAELAVTWMAIADEGDVLWCPQPIDPAFFDQLETHGFPQVQAVSDMAQIPAGCEFVPWGWTEEALQFGKRVRAEIHAPPLSAVRQVNSRRFSFEQEELLRVKLPGSTAVTTWSELTQATRNRTTSGWLIKTEYSQSGRDRFLFKWNDKDRGPKLQEWADPRLNATQVLFVEPLLPVSAEASVQMTVCEQGTVQLVGVCSTSYQNGAFLSGTAVTSIHEQGVWSAAVAAATNVGRAAADAGYFGPLGIDAMQYFDFNGYERVRPVQDINARWTMGRLTLGHRRLLQPGESARWLMGAAVGELLEGNDRQTSQRRIIPTSPAVMAGRPVRLRTALVIEAIDRMS